MTYIQNYLDKIEKIRKTGKATEASYRSSIEFLFSSLGKEIQALNEPKRVAVGAPDFIVHRGSIVVGHVEAKDLDIDISDLKGVNKQQQERYLNGLSNLVYTNGLDFDFFRGGVHFASVSIGENKNGIKPLKANFSKLEGLLKDFITQHPRTISSPRLLAAIMAGKAVLIKDILGNTLKTGGDSSSDLHDQYKAFKEHLIHDITTDEFSDIYAETIAYGLFAARLHDTTLDTFSRSEALDLLPKSNPFLRNLFSYIAGPNLDDRIRWIIDDLSDAFRSCDVRTLMQGFGRLTGQNDPFLHFYETFLAEYNPKKRKSRGVWYTPEPVVNFIVRAVDDVLQQEFKLADGLADTSKVTIDWDTGQRRVTKKGTLSKLNKNSMESKEVHRVQILDPATGTGTFLAEVIKQIAPKVKNIAEGMWSQYIEKDLIPRLHGFELLMASYAMCHLKLDMILTELGYKPTGAPPRLSVFLTNSLEEGEPANQSLPFAQWLSNEVKQANAIKRDLPIMCVIGNPPYAGETANKNNTWLEGLMQSYKTEPGGVAKLKEKNSKWINDDYMKFIRFAEQLIQKSGEGVLGFVTNHGYLDNPTFRGMRWQLLNTFDKLYIYDLHGNSKKKEIAPDGRPDKNVFDIQQGVAIMIAVRRVTTGKSKALAEVYHCDSWGEREEKYARLWAGPRDTSWVSLTPSAPQYGLRPVDHDVGAVYAAGFSTKDLFLEGGTGIVTKRDNLTIHTTETGVWNAVQDMLTLSEDKVRSKYGLPDDVRDWRFEWAKSDVSRTPSKAKIQPISYRPFDQRYIYFTGQSRGFVGWPVEKLMRHFIVGNNIGLATARSNKNPVADHFFITDKIMETKYSESSTQSCVFPLYLYPAPDELSQERRVNFNPKLHKKLVSLATDKKRGEPSELDIFDYIYAVLHCPAYRLKYASFLKMDFPKIPWPVNSGYFWRLADEGKKLRKLHLMDNAAVGSTPYKFVGEGDAVIGKPFYEGGSVWINETQRFIHVPPEAWAFSIGGYKPAYKWLKDRRGEELSFDEIKHYQRVIKVLASSHEIMKTIDMQLA